MCTYTFSQLSEETLKTLVTLKGRYVPAEEWDNMQIALTEDECQRLEVLKSTLRGRHLFVMNESTLWARAIYPMLVLAEHGYVQAWSGVPLKAAYPTFSLEGEADGALAPSLGGRIQSPYLIVHEAKRGLNAPDPLYQLLGEMLAAARLNWEQDANPEKFSDVTPSLTLGHSSAGLSATLTPKNPRSRLNSHRITTAFRMQSTSSNC